MPCTILHGGFHVHLEPICHHFVQKPYSLAAALTQGLAQLAVVVRNLPVTAGLQTVLWNVCLISQLEWLLNFPKSIEGHRELESHQCGRLTAPQKTAGLALVKSHAVPEAVEQRFDVCTTCSIQEGVLGLVQCPSELVGDSLTGVTHR